MQESESVFTSPSPMPRMKKTQILIWVCVLLFLGFVLYRLNSGQSVSFENRAANAVNLDAELSERVMVYGYSEQSADGIKYKLRVETPHSFAFIPQGLGLESTQNEITVKGTESEYPCMSMHGDDHMMGYESDWFAEGIGESLDAKVKVLFADESGKLFTSEYTLTHMCSVLSPDAVQQVEPPTELDAPAE